MKPIQFRGKETMSYNKTEQPTAEGAEEIDARTYFDEWMRQHNYRSNKLIGWSETVDFADDFATLHAQRIADKMVEKKLKKEYERGIEDGKIIGKHGSVSYIE
jgi:hypothetical protein